MNTGLINGSGFAAITGGLSAQTAATINNDSSKFDDLIKSFQNKDKKSSVSSSQILKEGRLNGDFSSGFEQAYKNEKEKNAMPQGAAANQANPNVKPKTIDKTSKLYEKSMELESYFVKQVLSSMRKTVNKSSLAGDNMAGKMYEDMLFDEYAVNMTKNAGFGLADQIYLSLV